MALVNVVCNLRKAGMPKIFILPDGRWRTAAHDMLKHGATAGHIPGDTNYAVAVAYIRHIVSSGEIDWHIDHTASPVAASTRSRKFACIF